MQSRQIIINQQLIHYYVSGDHEAATILLFLHGWRSQSRVWTPLVPQLKNYSLFLLDLPGFGQSPTPLQPFSLNDYARIVTNFIRKKELKNIVLIGHSFGGRIAIKIASQNPLESIKKIVLIDSAGIVKPPQRLKKIIVTIVRPLFHLSILQGLRRKIYRMMGAEDYVATPELKETFVRIINEDLTPALSAIRKPTLILWGENDRDTPSVWATIMRQKIRHSKCIILAKAGHYSFLDQPQQTVSALRQFIEEKI